VGIDLQIPALDHTFDGNEVSEADFAAGILPLLQTSQSLLAPFPNNDEKDDDDYAIEA